MRLVTFHDRDRPRVGFVRDDRLLPLDLPEAGFATMREIAGGGEPALQRIAEWAGGQPAAADRTLDGVQLGPVVPDPGSIYTVGRNYRGPDEEAGARPDRPLVYGKAGSSVVGHGSTVAWDRTLTDNVDAECELGVVIGTDAFDVSADEAMAHVFGYTIMNDISSRDPWLDGDQWLIGKSMPGFCPVGPWVVTRDEIDPAALGLGCTIDGAAIQAGRTDLMWFSVAEVIEYLSKHVRLRAGDLIATGTPIRLESPPGPGRRLQPGDTVTAWIEGIGELTTIIG